MMDILFKAKRLDNGEWVEGFLFLYDSWCIGRIDEPLAPNDHSELIGEGVDWFRIDANTICRYTGRTDKNGNKIWENDVVKHVTEGCVYKCIWNQYNCEYQLDSKDESFGMGYAAIYEYEVIGTIFDNPELLENE